MLILVEINYIHYACFTLVSDKTILYMRNMSKMREKRSVKSIVLFY